MNNKVNFVISALRVIAAAALMSQMFYMAGILFIAAEIFNIIKEII